jgi:UDP-N-acetylglucosamine diphosphorylase/glucosamine-1-phosphate N-acetyltransferase
MTERRALAVAILAAGKGKRMGNPDRAKVLTPLFDKPLLGYVLEQAATLSPDAVVVIVGHQREAVQAYVAEAAPAATCVVQAEQLGTGHAVQQTKPVLGDLHGDVIILSGDVPLLSGETLRRLVEHHRAADATATVLSTHVPDPTGYGRIVRDANGALERIVEQKDASEHERMITEINSGVYVIDADALFSSLDRVRNDNAQGEFYLTDVIGILRSEGRTVEAFPAERWEEVHGINTVDDLERAASLL